MKKSKQPPIPRPPSKKLRVIIIGLEGQGKTTLMTKLFRLLRDDWHISCYDEEQLTWQNDGGHDLMIIETKQEQP